MTRTAAWLMVVAGVVVSAQVACAGADRPAMARPRVMRALTVPRLAARPRFAVASVAELRLAEKGKRPVTAQKAPPNRADLPVHMLVPSHPPAAVAAAAYTAGKGVVLDALHLADPLTGSAWTVNGVVYNNALLQGLTSKDPNTAFQLLIPVNTSYPLWIAAEGVFQSLPEGTHTFVVTIGTTTTPEYTKLWVFNETGFFNVEPSQLTYNATTCELRGVFTLNVASADPKVSVMVNTIYGLNPKADPQCVGSAYLHHLQLVALD